MTVVRVAWMDLAECRSGEGSLFFPPDASERKEERLERELVAKRICQSCAVREECLEAALERHESHGIWGGLNEMERRILQRH